MKPYQLLSLLLILNTIITLIYFVVMYMGKKRRKKGIVISLFMLFCPVAAPFFLFCSWLMYFIWIKLGKRDINPRELSFSKEKVNLRAGTDVERDINRIPLEEALLVSSVKNKRETFLNVLKDDFEDSIGTIKNAIDNEDSEISHYVASSIMDVTAKFKEKEKIMYAAYQQQPTIESWKRYAKYVISFLKEELVTRPEEEKLMGRLEKDLDWFSEEQLESIGSALLANMVILWQRLGNYSRAEYWFRKGIALEDDNLEIYKAGLKNYYQENKLEDFKKLLKELKETSIIFDDEVLEWVRFFC